MSGPRRDGLPWARQGIDEWLAALEPGDLLSIVLPGGRERHAIITRVVRAGANPHVEIVNDPEDE